MYPELKAQRNHSDQNSEFLGTDRKSQLVNPSGSQSLADQIAKTTWNLTFKIIAMGNCPNFFNQKELHVNNTPAENNNKKYTYKLFDFIFITHC